MKIFLPCVTLLASCYSQPEKASEKPESVPLVLQRITKTVEVISNPPGARIEVNGDYIGDAPCAAEVTTDGNGNLVQPVRFTALPVFSGQYSQGKFFQGAHMSPYSQKAPQRVYFDMRLAPASNEINVNLR